MLLVSKPFCSTLLAVFTKPVTLTLFKGLGNVDNNRNNVKNNNSSQNNVNNNNSSNINNNNNPRVVLFYIE